MAGRKKVSLLTHYKREHKCPHCGVKGMTDITTVKRHKYQDPSKHEWVERYHVCKLCGWKYKTTGENLQYYEDFPEQDQATNDLDISDAPKISYQEFQEIWNKFAANLDLKQDYSQAPLEEVTL